MRRTIEGALGPCGVLRRTDHINQQQKDEHMADQVLRDRSGSVLGTIKTRSDGTQELRDRSGSLKGTYDPKADCTRLTSGSVFGKGNLLAALLFR